MNKNTNPATAITRRLLPWFDKHGRHDLPWQHPRNAYRVWISEIMLQQTQVATVIPYFERFMQSFPDVTTLADASDDDILHLWTGLGYYARARNLHKAAKQIVAEHHGKLPRDLEQLQGLPGIGRSTAGAILASAYDVSAPILDGNVKRVLARVHCIPGWSGHNTAAKQLWQLAEYYTPKSRCADYTQAIMDLGATVCTRSQPRCACCPLKSICQAYQNGRTADFPASKPRKRLPVRTTCFLILQRADGSFLLEKRPPTGIWGSLWCFPHCALDQDSAEFCRQQFGLRIVKQQALAAFRHTFSHFHYEIHPLICQVKPRKNQVMDQSRQIWYNPKQNMSLGLAAPVAKLLTDLGNEA